MKSLFPLKLLICLVLLAEAIGSPISANGQVQMNRFYRSQYRHYNWRAFHTGAFHIYFPLGEDSLCAAVAKELPGAIKVIQKRMGAGLQQPPNVIIYPSIQGLYETNIGSFEPKEITLPTFIMKGNRLVLAYNGSYRDLKDQLYETLARAAWETQLSGGLEAQATGAHKDAIPYWISEGSIRYFAHGWPLKTEDRLLNLLKDMPYSVWEELAAKYPALSGQAFCYFLSIRYFKQMPVQLFFQLRKRKPLARALRLITQAPADSLYLQCLQFYRDREQQVLPERDTALSPSFPTINLSHRKGSILKVMANPKATGTAFVVGSGHQRYLYTYDHQSRQRHLITTYSMPPWISDHSADQYPLFNWSDNGLDLLVALPLKGKLTLSHYTIGGLRRDYGPLTGIDGLGSIQSYGGDYLFSAWRRGQSDLVSYNQWKDKYTALTYDRWDDYQPAVGKGGNELYFTSARELVRSRKEARLTDTVTAVHGIFRVKEKEVTTWLVDSTDYIQYGKPVLLQNGSMIYTSTTNGSTRFVLAANKEQPSGKEFFRTTGNTIQYLPETGELFSYTADRDSLYLTRQPLQQWIDENRNTASAIAPWLADYRTAAGERAKEDSILKAAAGADETPSFLSGVLSRGNTAEKSAKRADSIRASLSYSGKKISPYILQLYSAYFTAKVNNDYFINRYQPYQSYQGNFKFPEIGGMAQGGFSDLFENHHFSIAFRLPAGSEGSDFFVKYGNTAKKLDWGISYYRKSEDLKPDPKRKWVDESGRLYPNTAKVKSNYYEVNAQYPLSYYSALGFSTAVRQDKTIFLATEKYSLDFPSYKSLWSITTLSYNINKLKPTLPLLYKGFSGNVKLDAFKGFTQGEEALAGGTINLSYHQPIYKYITIVGKFQAGTSGGDQKILYNLGGVDNNITPRVDSNVHFSQDAPYAFQTLVTPFRGYYQNSLYGSSFCLLNADVYFPLFQSLIPLETPLSFLNNLQLGLFTDLAAAGGNRIYSTSEKGWLSSFGCSARTTLAGYPLRFDIGWPGSFSRSPVWYLSLSVK